MVRLNDKEIVFISSPWLDLARKNLWTFLWEEKIYFHEDIQTLIYLINLATEWEIERSRISYTLNFQPLRWINSVKEVRNMVEKIIQEFKNILD